MAESQKPTPVQKEDLAVEDKDEVKRPRRFLVVFHNDDYTTQEFVVHVLVEQFHKTATEAIQIMLHVHHRGWGVVGTYGRDVAESKAAQAMAYARVHGQPLKVTAEPEGYEG